jgi:competence protein ComEA
METEPINWQEVQQRVLGLVRYGRQHIWACMAVVVVVTCIGIAYALRTTLRGFAQQILNQEVIEEVHTVEVPAFSLEERYAELVSKMAAIEALVAQSTAQSKAQREAFELAIAEVAQQNTVLTEQSEALRKALTRVPGLASTSLSPPEKSNGAGTGQPEQSGKVNINTATASELDALPGIGPSYAERIVAYRAEHGAFTSIEDIQNVPGIGPATFAKIADAISV